MSRGVFHSSGGKAEEWCFQTSKNNTSPFAPNITTATDDRVTWDFGDGSLIVGNGPSYTYSDTGTTKTVCVKTNRISDLGTLSMDSSEAPIFGPVDDPGHLDFSKWSNFGYGGFMTLAFGCCNAITKMTLPPTKSPHTLTNLYLSMPITELDLSTVEVGGSFVVLGSLTSVTHTYTTQNFNTYNLNGNDLIGDLNLTMLPNLGGVFTAWGNTTLTSVTHTASTRTFSEYSLYFCDITGIHDVSMLSGLGGQFRMNDNSNLNSILNPTSTQTFNSYHVYDCNIDYINFYPLSGTNMNNIRLDDNNMTAAEVNRFLVDFDDLSTNVNPSGWSGITLQIHGTNSAPDSSSGGYDGLAALSSLTGGTNNWTITTS
jgi:hypothetical protein